MNKIDVIQKMKETYQIPNKQTVWEHGSSVHEYYLDLFSNERKKEWRIPEWFMQNINFIKENLHSDVIIQEYALFHDCGKPFCQSVDEYG